MIRVGPAGWSYADWEGAVYPRRKPAGFHPLQTFPTIQTLLMPRTLLKSQTSLTSLTCLKLLRLLSSRLVQ